VARAVVDSRGRRRGEHDLLRPTRARGGARKKGGVADEWVQARKEGKTLVQLQN
jgi:hypothetical protein